MHWWMAYGVLTAGAVGLTYYGCKADARRSGDTLGAAAVLALLWLLSNATHWLLKPYMAYFPFLDAFTACCMAWAWRRTYSPWRVVLILLFVAECLIHAGYFATGDWSRAASYSYTLKRNLIYIAQLACVSHIGLKCWLARFVTV